MCHVCWVNDHMYCCNMKRVARELPSFSGCIHYIPCEHFLASTASVSTSAESRGKSMSLRWTNLQTGGKVASHRVVSAEDLLCDEDMLESDSEMSADSVEGTELLQIQLKARTDQIFRSLGVRELPTIKSPSASSVPEPTVAAEDDDVMLMPEEYAAEVVVYADGDLSLIHI